MKQKIKSAFEASTQQESIDIEKRFDRANTIFLKENQRKTTETNKRNQELIRKTFTIRESEMEMIKEIKRRCTLFNLQTSGSEIVRTGLKWLFDASTEELKSAMERVSKIKPGSPKKSTSS